MKRQSNTPILLEPVLLSHYRAYSIVGAKVSMPVLAITRIGRYYRTTVPREVRKLLNINENDMIEWVFEDGKVIVRKASGGSNE